MSEQVLGGPPRNPLAGLTIGRMVHVVLASEPFKHRPAIVTEVVDGVAGEINCVVFLDGPNDVEPGKVATSVWTNNRQFDDTNKAPGTWHWIERAD